MITRVHSLRLFASTSFLLALAVAPGCDGCGGEPVIVDRSPGTVGQVLLVQPGSERLAVGESVTLRAFLDEDDVTDRVEWSASSDVVTLDGSVVTGAARGEATVTATHGAHSASAAITVRDARLLSLALSPDSATVAAGRTQAFTVSGTFSDGTTRALNDDVEWLANPAQVATISSDGVARGSAEGTALIRAVVGGMTSPHATLNVLPPVVEQVSVSPDSVEVPLGLTQPFTATATLSDGAAVDVTDTATWSSSAPSVATVEGGVATAHGAGSAEVSAAFDGVLSLPATLSVSAPVVMDLAITPDAATIPLGASQAFAATATWSDGSSSDETTSADWSSSDDGVVFVELGVATATGLGGAELSASFDGVTAAAVPVTVNGATIATIALDPASASVAKGVPASFVATATYTDGTLVDVSASASWSSSSPGVAQVSAGTATTLDAGTTEITAAQGGVSSPPAVLSVTNAVIVAIALDLDEASVAEGASQPFVATALWSDGTETDISASATWTSSDENVAVVSEGIATGVGVGTADISASQGGVSSPAATLTVTPVELVSLALAPRGALLLIGETTTLTASGEYSDQSEVDVTDVAEWQSSDESVVTVVGGVVTAIGVGTALVTATSGGVTSPPATLVVSATPLASLAVDPSSASIPKGTAQSFAATGTFEDSTTAVLTAIVDWVSSDDAVATLDFDGVATGHAEGVVDVTASLHGITSPAAALTVVAPAVVSVSVDPTTASLAKGLTRQLTATASYTDGSTATVTADATWTSSDALTVSVDAAGLVNALEEGSAEIVASYDGVDSEPTVVTVLPKVLEQLVVAPHTAAIAKGQSQAFTLTGLYSDASSDDFTADASWVSLDTSAATLSSPGVAFGEGVGTAGIRAQHLGLTSNTATLEVGPAIIVSIDVAPDGVTLAKGRTAQLTATATLSDGTVVDVTADADWQSDSTNVTVDANGVVTAAAVGAAQVTGSLDGVTSDPAQVDVTAAVVDSVAVTPLTASVAKGLPFNGFLAEATWSDASVTNVTSSATWTTTNSSIATVSSGVATGVNEGTAGIGAVFGGVTSNQASLTVTAPIIMSIAVAPGSVSLAKGRTEQLTATANWSDGTTTNINSSATWTSTNTTRATVSAGLVTAVDVGSATVTAQQGGVTSNGVVVTVTAAELDRVTLSPTSASLAKGRTQSFTATAHYSDSSTLSVTSSATWTSSDALIASVDGVGLVRALEQGSAAIVARYDGVDSDPAVVTVLPKVLEELVVAPSTATIAKGASQSFTVTGHYSDASTDDFTNAATWVSLNTSAATFSSPGVAFGAGVGTAGIRAQHLGLTSNTATLEVGPAVIVSIAVTPANVSLAEGRTQQLTATATWSDGATTNIDNTATWTNTNTASATVSAGLVTAVDVGSATVTAQQGGVTSNDVVVTVTAAELERVTLSPTTASVAKGRTQAFTATAHYSDNSTLSVTSSATWSSDDPAIAQVSSSGVASTYGVGQAGITASYDGVTSSAATLTVTPAVLEAVVVSPVSPEVAAGFSIQLVATGRWSDDTVTDMSDDVTWSSGTPSVASVSASGLATGVSGGTSLLTAEASAALGGVSGSTLLTVTNATLTGMTVTPNSSRIPTGGVRVALRATGFFNNGSSLDVTNSASWTSLNPTAASVSDTIPEKGIVTSGSPVDVLVDTNVSITASMGAVSATSVVTVIPATLESITVSPTNASLPLGYTLPFGAAGAYSDGNIYDLTLTVLWESSDESVAVISNSAPDWGDALGLSVGNTTISATHAGQSGSTTLTVSDATLIALSVTPATATRSIGLTAAYTVDGVFSDGVTLDLTASASWSSSDTDVATIMTGGSLAGVATVVGAGTTTIEALFGGLSAPASLTGATPALTGVLVTPAGAVIGVDGFVQMNATATFSDGTTADVTSLATWTSSDASIAIVREDASFRGMVVGVGPGAASIVATYGTLSGARTVTVTSATLDEIYLIPALATIGVGTTLQFQASGVWTDETTADLTEVANWTSSDPSVATISNVVGSRGLATAVSADPASTTTITASYRGISDLTTLTVTDAPLVAIHVTPQSRSVPLGTDVPYAAVAEYADGVLQNVTTQVGWLSSDTSVVLISNADGSEGLATSVGPGDAVITAQLGAMSGSADINVRNVFLDALTLTPENALIPIEFSRQYSLQGLFSDGTTENLTTQASWTTNDPDIALASNAPGSRGSVAGLALGSATVTATVFGQQASTPLEVVDYTLCSLSVGPIGQTIGLSETLQMTATGSFGALCPAVTPLLLDVTKQVTWRVVPRQTITVSNSAGTEGLVTATSRGPPSLGNVQAQRVVDGLTIQAGAQVRVE